MKENQFNNQFNKKYKDRLFRLIFREKEDLLELYNAVNDSHHTNLDDLTITTIEDVVYMGMKNDLSFIIGDVMNLYEHQSSFSPNLPLRGLFYFASLYRNHIESVKQRLYMDLPLSIPFPQYIVFYNGTKEEPERQELKLSALFTEADTERTPALECTAIVLNINLGQNRELMERCRMLGEYARFIAVIRRHTDAGEAFQSAVEQAVEECIQKGILSEILRKNRAEVVDMILTEYDEKEFRDFAKKEYWREGHESGLKEGRKSGLKEGICGTIRTCRKYQISREETLVTLKEEYGLSEAEAQEYLGEYWE